MYFTRQNRFNYKKMILIRVFLVVGTLCFADAMIANTVTLGFHAEVKFFNKSFIPIAVSSNGVFSRSLLSCAIECRLQNCANLIYNHESHDCILNEEFVNFPSETIFQDNTPEFITFIEFQQNSWGIGVAPTVTCTTDVDCLSVFSANSQCGGGTCACSPCYKYVNSACLPATTCIEFEAEFVVYPGCVLYMNADVELTGKTLEQCKAACLSETSFICRSIDFRAFDGYCQLTGSNKCMEPESFKTGYSSWAYYHRKCKL